MNASIEKIAMITKIMPFMILFLYVFLVILAFFTMYWKNTLCCNDQLF